MRDHCDHRQLSWSALMVHDLPSMPPCGPSTKQSVAISRCGSYHRPGQYGRHGSRGRGPRPRQGRSSGQVCVHGGRVDEQTRQDRGRDPAGPTHAGLARGLTRWAAMVGVGSIGLKHSAHGRIGSTAAALASSAHCPVAIVRGHDPLQTEQQWVVAELDEAPASEGVLRRALEQAQRRGAPLRVLVTWQSRFGDVHDGHAVADGNRLAKAQLDRRLAHWRKRYPDLNVQAVAVHGCTLNFLTKNASSIQLLVAGHERAQGINALVGPPGYAALHNGNRSLLICEPQNVL